MPDITHDFRDALLSLDRVRAEQLFRDHVAETGSLQAVEAVIVPVLQEIGAAWETGRLALSQVYMSGRICEDLVNAVLPAPASAAGAAQTDCALVVLSDYHTLGKRIVLSVLRASGHAVADYGRMDVPTLVDRTLTDRPKLLLVSTLMLPAALKVRDVRDALTAAGFALRIAVGGAPFLFDPGLWQEVGADAMGHNAGDAIRLVRHWTGGDP